MKQVWRIVKLFVLLLVCAVVIPIVIALGRASVECRAFSSSALSAPDASGAPATAGQPTAGIEGYTRPEDQTYLTLPEWYIVYNADEYAAFIEQNPPSHFAYFGSISQFWQNYYDVCAVMRDQYPFNRDYHIVVSVIGSSFTAENILKGLYENTIGRVSEWTSGGDKTQEDEYAQKVAAEYGQFLHTIPWYRFPFGERLGGLWRETDPLGPHIIRKWERKFALTLEYGTKAAYGWLIKLGTGTAFSPDELEMYVWAEGVSDAVLQQPEVTLVKRINADTAIIAVPRYEPFTQLVPRLAQQGVRFVELAGNDEIMITVIAPAEWTYDLKDGTALFAQPILAQPGTQRIAVNVPVAVLHRALAELASSDARLEHIYDY